MKNTNIMRSRYQETKNNAKIAGVALLGVIIGSTYTFAYIKGKEAIQELQGSNTVVIINQAKAKTVEAATEEEPASTEVPEQAPKTANPDREKIDKLIKAEFASEEVEHARKIVWCESRYNAGAHNYNPSTGDDSVGLGQINLLGSLFEGRLIRAQYLGYAGKPTREGLIAWLKIPENNIKYLASMQRTSGWDKWSCDSMVRDPNWKYRDQMLAFLNQ